jgi:hypothetical protein
MVENPEEDSGAGVDVLTPNTLTSKSMSLAFNHIEEGLDSIKVCNILYL